MRPVIAILCTALALAATSAQASVFDVYGMTSRGSAMGGAIGAAALDHSAVYYNPAALTRRKKVHFGATLQVVVPALSIEQPSDTTRQAVLPESNVGATVGVVFPLAGKLDDRVALGIAIFLPLLNPTRYESIDPATPQFHLYQSLPDALVLSGALAFEIFDWLSVGLGAQVLANFDGKLELDLDLPNRRVEHRKLGGAIVGDVGPIVGLHVGPLAGLSFGFTYRGNFGLAFNLPIDLRINDVGLLAIQASGQGLYSPDQFNFGFAFDFESVLPDLPLLVTADLTWMRWSQAPSPAIDVVAVLDDTGLDPDAEEPGTILGIESVNAELGAKDTLIPRVGLEYRHSELLTLQGGYHFKPTPIPDPVGYYSYVDNNAHVLSLGGSLTFEDPLEVHRNPMSIDLFLQLSVLEERFTAKDIAQDLQRVGAFTSSGTIWNFGVEWQHDF